MRYNLLSQDRDTLKNITALMPTHYCPVLMLVTHEDFDFEEPRPWKVVGIGVPTTGQKYLSSAGAVRTCWHSYTKNNARMVRILLEEVIPAKRRVHQVR